MYIEIVQDFSNLYKIYRFNSLLIFRAVLLQLKYIQQKLKQEHRVYLLCIMIAILRHGFFRLLAFFPTYL